jgi:Na+/glutamate symporter
MSVIAGAQRTTLRASAGRLPLGALFALGAGLLALLGSAFRLDRLGFPLCMFKATTGLPCLTCGSTRALVRLAHLDVPGAVALNPLVALALIALVLWGLADGVLALRGRALVLEVGPTLSRVLLWGAIPLLLANWAYLVAVAR